MSEDYIYGIHSVTAFLKKPKPSVTKLYLNTERMDSRSQEILELAKTKQIEVCPLSASQMKQRFPEIVHQGVVACVSNKQMQYDEQSLASLIADLKKPALILILDGITDPHNLGACLRVADGAGVDFVILPKDRSANLTHVVSKVASGAAESIPLVRVTNLVRAMEVLKEAGIWIYGATGEVKESLYNLECTGSIALVMGGEGAGLRRLTRECCDGLFSLPMLGSVESLNVSVAAGVCLYETIRQRKSYLSS